MFGAGHSVLRGLIPLNRSPNSAIFSVSSAYWPDVVLKRNSLQQAVTQVQMQHAIRHIRVLPPAVVWWDRCSHDHDYRAGQGTACSPPGTDKGRPLFGTACAAQQVGLAIGSWSTAVPPGLHVLKATALCCMTSAPVAIADAAVTALQLPQLMCLSLQLRLFDAAFSCSCCCCAFLHYLSS